MKNTILILIFSALFIMSCGGADNSIETFNDGNSSFDDSNVDLNEWLIPIEEVRDAAGKDGIPSIDSPEFGKVDEVSSTLTDDLLVIGIKEGNIIKAYPHFILDWHEIVNDNLGDVSVAVTYCPLTGTAIGWNSMIKGSKTTFGVSGFLYNNNLIPYDRLTDSNWSQIGLQCVNGELAGDKPEIISLIETTWGVWKSMYSRSSILNTNTGTNRPYDNYPYGDYKTNNGFLLFPLNPSDERLPNKERVHAIIDNNGSKVYRFNSFVGGGVIIDTFKGKEILVVGDQSTIVSFELNAINSTLNFEYAYNGSETFFKDNQGTEWNIFGEAISGPGIGNKLNPKTSFMAYWFSIGAFYPNAVIYSE